MHDLVDLKCSGCKKEFFIHIDKWRWDKEDYYCEIKCRVKTALRKERADFKGSGLKKYIVDKMILLMFIAFLVFFLCLSGYIFLLCVASLIENVSSLSIKTLLFVIIGLLIFRRPTCGVQAQDR